MNELIAVTPREIDGAVVLTTDGRELHSYLKVETEFKNWIARRIEEYRFEEGKDFRSFLTESTGGRPPKEYTLTLNMAKELAMVERTPKGREARQYYIDCEARAIASESRHVPVPEKVFSQTGLPEFRRARALEMAAKTAERIVAQFPSLSEDSRRVVFAKVINPVAGTEILALPRVMEKHCTAGEVGEMLGISANMVGRIANLHSLKTEEFGRYQLDKSAHSIKQVEAFVYNAAGIKAIKLHMDSDKSKQEPTHRPTTPKPKRRRISYALKTPEPQGALL